MSECRARDGVWRLNTSSHAHFSQSCRVAHAWAHWITHTCVWLKGLMTQVTGKMCCLDAHPKSLRLTACFTEHFSACLTPSHRSVRPLTGIRSILCASSLEERRSAYLAESLTHLANRAGLSKQPRSQADQVHSRRNSFNIENFATTAAASETFDSFFIGKRQPAVARSPYQQVR